MKRVRMSVVFLVLAVLALLASVTIESAVTQRASQAKGEEGPRRMGGYEVVENWPKPLPDTDLSHNGWTWGSGCGAWAEDRDKAWIRRAWRDRASAVPSCYFRRLARRRHGQHWPVADQVGIVLNSLVASCCFCS